MSIIKRIAAIILAAGLCLSSLALAENVPSFATIGDAMDSESYTGVTGGDDQHFVVVVEKDGSWIRLIADLDDEARRLAEATLVYESVEALDAAFDAYNEYLRTLPVAYEEKITAAPLTREELDALAGKTLLETEEAGFEFSSYDMGENDAILYIVSFGLYEYNLLLNETYTEYMEHEDNGYTGDLTVKSAEFAGLSRNAAELRYHADGTYDEENDPFAEYNGIMELIGEALSGDNPEEAIQALTEAMPDQAETIRTFADLFTSVEAPDQE